MRVLVCGGRAYSDRAYLFRVLDELHVQHGVDELIDGAAQGADTLASEWATSRQVANRRFQADWRRHGKAAGPIRNAQMLREGAPDLVIAFPGGRGTADMIAQAERAKVPVITRGF